MTGIYFCCTVRIKTQSTNPWTGQGWTLAMIEIEEGGSEFLYLVQQESWPNSTVSCMQFTAGMQDSEMTEH